MIEELIRVLEQQEGEGPCERPLTDRVRWPPCGVWYAVESLAKPGVKSGALGSAWCRACKGAIR